MSGILYIFLALLFLGVTGVGVSYKMDTERIDSKFYGKDDDYISRGQAANFMIPAGLLIAIGCGAFGAMRIRGAMGQKKEEQANP